VQQLQATTPRGYSADTEILTHAGWKLLGKLGDDDEIATRGETGLFQWQKPTARESSLFDGQMVEFRNKSIDLLVTPDHPMLVRKPIPYGVKHPHADGLDLHFRPASHLALTPTSQWHVPATSRWCPTQWPAEFFLPGWEADRRHPAHERATEWLAEYLKQDWTPSAQVIAAYKAAGISDNGYFAARKNLGITSRFFGGYGHECWWEVSAPTREYVPFSGHYTPMREFRMPMKAFCAFLGLFIAEGWVRLDRNDIIIAQFVTSRHMPAICDILSATGLCWNYDERNGKFTTSHKTLAPWLRENAGMKARNKRVPGGYKDLPADILNEMLRGMMMGDGHETEGGQRCYTTTSIRLADDVQEIFQKTGLNAVVTAPDFSKYPATGFGYGNKRQAYVVRERKRPAHLLPRAAWIDYCGTVHHVTVPNGTVYVRRNWKPLWSG